MIQSQSVPYRVSHFVISTCAVLFALMLFLPTEGLAKTEIEFILDLSGSMRKVSGGETQLASARKALFNALKDIPADTPVAIRGYGHRIDQANKDESCKDSELIVPFAPVNLAAIKAKISALDPKGYTPIAYSLEQAQSDFKAEREANKVIILLSDGEETCGGNPAETLTQLKAAGFEVIVHTVGFNVDATTKKQLQAIAAAGGGQYFDAQGASALNASLKEATQQSLVISKEKATYGTEIRGGDSYETAVSIGFDTEYRLDHHQKKNDYDYFKVDLRPGEEMTLELHTLEKGVSLRKETPVETGSPYAGAQLHNQKREKLKKIILIGAHKVDSMSYSPSTAGTYYILIGTSYDNMNKDHSSFKLTKASRGDLGSNNDAGSDSATAMPILTQRYKTNYIGGGDDKDVFAFAAKGGEEYFIGIIPNSDTGTWFKVSVHDDYKKKITSFSSGINEGIKSKPFKITDDGTYYLTVTTGTGISKPLGYTLELKLVIPKTTSQN